MKRDPRFDILFEPVQIFGMILSKARPWIKGISANRGAGRSMQAGCPGRGPRGGRPDPVDASAVTAR
jgi:hypothetical protein